MGLTQFGGGIILPPIFYFVCIKELLLYLHKQHTHNGKPSYSFKVICKKMGWQG
jgi:hypothetical protein